MMQPKVLQACGKQISFGLHELIRTNVNNITLLRDWITILTLLEVVGAGAQAPIVKPGPSLTMIQGDNSMEQEQIEEETGERMYRPPQGDTIASSVDLNREVTTGEDWLLVNKEEQPEKPVNQFDLAFGETLDKHDSRAFIKASGTLGFIVRDANHVSRENLFPCIHSVLVFAEASSNGGIRFRIEDSIPKEPSVEKKFQTQKGSKKLRRKFPSPKSSRGKHKDSALISALSEDEAEISESTSNIYDAISLQLLDLMYTLHTNSASLLGNISWDQFEDYQKSEVRTRWSSKESIDQLPSTFKGKNAMSCFECEKAY